MKNNLSKLLVALSILLTTTLAQSEPLTIAIAANLKYVFDDIALAFKKETGIEIQSVLNSSGKIANTKLLNIFGMLLAGC